MSKYYGAIFGAGIAGTAIANALLERGKNVLLIDPYVSENAPGAPAALVNPATGKRAKLCWRGYRCYTALRKQVEKLMSATGNKDLISDSGVIRPAITEKLAENYRAALEKYDWPAGWVQWMDEQEIHELNPEIAPNHGGLYVKCGYTVFVDRYLNTYRRYLREKGAECCYKQADYRYKNSHNQFEIQFANGQSAVANYVIIATGYKTPGVEHWSHLPLELVKGQIIRFEANRDLPWNHALSAKGYSMRRGTKDIIVGSTYEHNFNSLNTTEEAYKRIREKLAFMYPGLANDVERKDQMAGVRVTTPNRLPVIGRHHEWKNLCIYTGMNSKGLLFSHYVAELLADHLLENAAIPEEVDVDRFR